MTSTRARFTDSRPPVVWEPTPERLDQAGITRFERWLASTRGLRFDNYSDLWNWSVTELDEFWSAVWEFVDVISHKPYQSVLEGEMPGASWFTGATLNFAEHALRRADDDPAVFFEREDGISRTLSANELRSEVAAIAAGLRGLGLARGERVIAVLPNCPEAIIAMLACASIGAIWSACSPELGLEAIVDRFAQIEPVLLISVEAYFFGGKRFDVAQKIDGVLQRIPTIKHHVAIPYLDVVTPRGAQDWNSLRSEGAALQFEEVPFDHPLWIVYSSGTTGLPKPIVHGHGGTTVEHLKIQILHQDLGMPDQVVMALASTSWVLWNVLLACLMSGAAIVLYDGSPTFPDHASVWRRASRLRVTDLRVGAAWIQSCMSAGVRPRTECELGHLSVVLSTGSPLPPEGFQWIVDEVGRHVLPASSCGGTDVCTPLVTSVPILPVRSGEIQGKALGAAVAAFDESGCSVIGELGEFVVTRPLPSMPLFLWNDWDGSRLRDSYFARFPGVWCNGDWVRFDEAGSCVILGRSDATLNRGGVRMGTAEFYRVIESIPGVVDSLVVDTGHAGRGGELLLFVVLQNDRVLGDLVNELHERLRIDLSPRHIPDRVIAVPEIPYTLTGKKCEVPVKRVVQGIPLSEAVSLGALRNPEAFELLCASALERPTA